MYEIINNLAADYSISLKFCKSLNIRSRNVVKVQGQGVKGQGHSVI